MSEATSIEDLMTNLDAESRDRLRAAYEKDKIERAELVKTKVVEQGAVIIGAQGGPNSVSQAVS